MFTVLAGLCSAASYAVSDMLSQRASRIDGVIQVALWVFAVGAAVSMPAALIVDGLPSTPEEWRAVGISVAAGIVYVGAYFSLLSGLKSGNLSLVAALNSLQGLYTSVFAIATGEPVTVLLAVGLSMAIVGGAMASMQELGRTAAGARWGLLSGFCFSLVVILYDQAGALSWVSQAACSRTTSFVIMLAVAAFASGLRAERRVLRLVLVAGLLEIAGLSLLTISVTLGPLAVAGVTASQFGTFAVLLGLVFLHERPRPHQLVGIIVTLAAVSILSLVR